MDPRPFELPRRCVRVAEPPYPRRWGDLRVTLLVGEEKQGKWKSCLGAESIV